MSHIDLKSKYKTEQQIQRLYTSHRDQGRLCERLKKCPIVHAYCFNKSPQKSLAGKSRSIIHQNNRQQLLYEVEKDKTNCARLTNQQSFSALLVWQSETISITILYLLVTCTDEYRLFNVFMTELNRSYSTVSRYFAQ